MIMIVQNYPGISFNWNNRNNIPGTCSLNELSLSLLLGWLKIVSQE